MNDPAVDRLARIADDLDRFIREKAQLGNDDLLDHDVDVFESGHLTSVGGLELISFVESRYGVRIPDAVVLDPRFGSVNGMSALLARQIAAAANEPARG